MADLFIFGYGSSAPPKIDISSATVTLGSALIYTGNELTQSITSVVVNGTTLTEGTDYNVTDNTGTNAGNYTLTIMGIGAYTGTKTASWNIAKAAGSVSFNPTSLSLDSSNLTGAISVTRAGNGTISAQSSNTSVATVSVSGTTVTVTAIASGSATVTVSVAAGSNYGAVSGTVSVSVLFVDSTLANNSPDIIQAVAQAGTGSSYWSVGDKTAPITISTTSDLPNFTPPSEGVCAFIIGFNHNSSVEGTGIHFQFGKTTGGVDVAFIDSGYGSNRNSYIYFNMNNTNTNSGGWASSGMRNTICPAFLSALPSAWQNVIASTIKYTDNTGGGSDTASYVTTTSDKIWLLAEYEVFGSRKYANSGEQNYQAQYDYYKNGNSKIKYKHISTSSTCLWSLRSPYSSGSSNFCEAYTNGGVYYSNAYASIGFAPGFKIAAPVPVTLISFTIDGDTYQAEDGMTFGEWVYSDYNTSGYSNSEGRIQRNSYYIRINGTDVTISSTIIANAAYDTYYSTVM